MRLLKTDKQVEHYLSWISRFTERENIYSYDCLFGVEAQDFLNNFNDGDYFSIPVEKGWDEVPLFKQSYIEDEPLYVEYVCRWDEWDD